MEKDKNDERNGDGRKKEMNLISQEAEHILNDYSCGLTCMVCPFPGGKCSQKNLANPWKTSSDPWREERENSGAKKMFRAAPGVCTEIEFELKETSGEE